MAFASALAVYFIIWWLTLFCVLPFGVRSQEESGEVVPGSEPGAPVATRIGRVVLINSGVALAVFGVFWAVYVLNVLDLQAIRDLRRE
jgi:predicted secreted protein